MSRWTMEVNTWNCYCASKMIFSFELRWWCCLDFRSFSRSALVSTAAWLVLLVAQCCLPSLSFRVINGIFHVSAPAWKCQVHLQGVLGTSQVTIPLFSGISFVRSWAPTLKNFKSRKGVFITVPARFDGDPNLSCRRELVPGEGQTPTLIPWMRNSVHRESSQGIFVAVFAHFPLYFVLL